MWFDTIVDSASAATITIDVAAENPPSQHEEVGVRPGLRQRQADHGDGHDEKADEHEVERKGPGRRRQVPFVGVFHHQHLEHARQAQDREGRQRRQPQPPRTVPVGV
jgi:hypothetical protein